MKPFVGISCCSKSFGPNGIPNHAASDFCVRAVAAYADAIPVLLPALGSLADPESLLDRLDGVLLTGSKSNVAPGLYGERISVPSRLADHGRDATTLPLIRAALRRRTPVLAICRGLQELNVALGGSLHRQLDRVPGRVAHACASPDDPQRRVAPAHAVTLPPGGRLAGITGRLAFEVNSLHHQGIDRLGEGLLVEATAPDGTIEAVSYASAPFVLGVQWHPEFDPDCNAVSASIFRGFGAALYRSLGGERLAAD